MSIFTDYAAKMRQQQTPFNGGLQTYLQGQDKVRQASPLFNTGKMAGIGQQPGVVPPAADTTPVIDSSNAMASLAEMMGPTPAEREAVERRMMRNRAQMTAWTGFFDGLRQLGNLYYASKGATPQKFDNPYGQVDQNFQQQRQLWNDMANYRHNYATSLYNIRRQMESEQQKKEIHQAQLDWYKNRDEQNTRKVDIQQFKAESDAAYKQGTLDQKEKLLEIRQRLADGEISLKEARRQQALAMAAKAGLAGLGSTTITEKTDKDGNVIKTKVTKAPGTGNRVRKNGKGVRSVNGSGKTVVKW